MLVNYAEASAHIPTAQGFLARINDAVLYPLLTLLTAVAVLVFLYGCFEYVRNSANQEGRASGGRHIIWGIVGIVIMLSAYAILGIAAGTFNLRGELDRVSPPPGAWLDEPSEFVAFER